MREQIFEYVKEKYGSQPEYLWKRFPDYAIFRHSDNRKWYGLVMNVQGSKLGMDTDDEVDILNVKLDDPFLVDMLVRQPGYFRGYHISRGNWISILLNGTVPFEEICGQLDSSYLVTASKQKKEKARPPKEWLIPSNPKYYDVIKAFEESDLIDWKQGAGIRTGDTVYLYVGAPISAILYKCKVLETDIPYDYSNGQLTIRALMKIQLEHRYSPDQFPLAALKEEYGVYAVRGPRGVPNHLSEALHRL